MAKFYVLQIRMGSLTLEQVPERWRAQVEALLAGEGGT